MAYNYAPKTTIDPQSGSMFPAGNGDSVQTASGFICEDSNSTPVTSPVAYSTTPILITVPEKAMELVISPTTDIKISELADCSNYDFIVGGTKEVIPCSKMDKIYIVRSTVDGSAYFRFNTI